MCETRVRQRFRGILLQDSFFKITTESNLNLEGMNLKSDDSEFLFYTSKISHSCLRVRCLVKLKPVVLRDVLRQLLELMIFMKSSNRSDLQYSLCHNLYSGELLEILTQEMMANSNDSNLLIRQ